MRSVLSLGAAVLALTLSTSGFAAAGGGGWAPGMPHAEQFGGPEHTQPCKSFRKSEGIYPCGSMPDDTDLVGQGVTGAGGSIDRGADGRQDKRVPPPRSEPRGPQQNQPVPPPPGQKHVAPPSPTELDPCLVLQGPHKAEAEAICEDEKKKKVEELQHFGTGAGGGSGSSNQVP